MLVMDVFSIHDAEWWSWWLSWWSRWLSLLSFFLVMMFFDVLRFCVLFLNNFENYYFPTMVDIDDVKMEQCCLELRLLLYHYDSHHAYMY